MNNGRPGMSLWKIFVLGVLRLDLSCDYDRLCELANNHKTIRQMLGHSDIFDNDSYNLQTLKDNVSLLKADLLEEINFDGWAIVEQDMYPAPFDKPLPIARHNREYLRSLGIG